MRKVFRNHQEVAHVWAQQSQSEGRTSDGRVFFTYGIIYSYGTHFPIAAFVDDNGHKAILFTSERYSVSTGAHISLVRRALGYGDSFRDMPIFTVADVPARSYSRIDHAANVKGFTDKFAESLKKAAASRVYAESHMTSARQTLDDLREYVTFFAIPDVTLPVMPESLDAIKATIKADRKAKAIEAKAERERMAARLLERAGEWMDAHQDVKATWDGTLDNANELAKAFNAAERERLAVVALGEWMDAHQDVKATWDGSYESGHDLKYAWECANRERMWREGYEAWMRGDKGRFDGLYNFPTALRIRGGEVETSRGAYFPVAHAIRGLALVRAVMARGEEWHTNGHTCHLGHYQIDRISADGTVYAGCHVVPWEAIERIAPQLDAMSAGIVKAYADVDAISAAQAVN